MSKLKYDKVTFFQFGPEAQKTLLDGKKSQEREITLNDFKCDHIDYKCRKHSTLKNHINLKHTEHRCTICSELFKTSMELVSHVAKDHHEEEEVWNVRFQSTPKYDKEPINSSFVFSESMQDDFS